MPMDAPLITDLIQKGIPDAQIRIIDLAGDGDHYAVEVVSATFAGKTRVQQHQMVYAALGERMGGELHALSVQTKLPQSGND